MFPPHPTSFHFSIFLLPLYFSLYLALLHLLISPLSFGLVIFFFQKMFYFVRTKAWSSYCIFHFSFSSFCLVLSKSLASPSISSSVSFCWFCPPLPNYKLLSSDLQIHLWAFSSLNIYLNLFSFSPVEVPIFHILSFLLFSFPTTRWKSNP